MDTTAALNRIEILDLLDRAVVKGLVVLEGDRYRLIESVRDYAREIVLESEDHGARNLHFDFYFDLTKDTEEKVRGPEQGRWLRAFDAERENIRAALDWGFRNPARYNAAIEMLYNFTPFEFIKGAYLESLRRFNMALQLDVHFTHALRSRILRRAGLMGMYSQDPRTKDWLSAALEAAKKSGDQAVLADGLFTYGNYLHLGGDSSGARPFIQEAWKKFKELNDVYGEGFAVITLANMAAIEERYDEARLLYDESLRVRKESGDLRGIGASLSALASLDMKLGDLDAARSLIREGLSLFMEVGTEIDFADSIPRAAWYAAKKNQSEIAAQLLGFSDASIQRGKGRRDRTDQTDYEIAKSISRETLGIGEYEHLWRMGRSLTANQAYDLALSSLEPR